MAVLKLSQMDKARFEQATKERTAEIGALQMQIESIRVREDDLAFRVSVFHFSSECALNLTLLQELTKENELLQLQLQTKDTLVKVAQEQTTAVQKELEIARSELVRVLRRPGRRLTRLQDRMRAFNEGLKQELDSVQQAQAHLREKVLQSQATVAKTVVAPAPITVNISSQRFDEKYTVRRA